MVVFLLRCCTGCCTQEGNLGQYKAMHVLKIH
nr:MAG TPA: Vascular endothelial growth factor venom [Caudoviricetes sp.]